MWIRENDNSFFPCRNNIKPGFLWENQSSEVLRQIGAEAGWIKVSSITEIRSL